MQKPKVSIVMPTLNEEAVIEETLNSIISQKNPPAYEIIIADGGSKDGTLKIAKKYVDFIVVGSKKTISAGRSSGAFAATGEIIVTVDADSYYPQNWLNNLIKPFSRKEVIGCFGKVLPKDGDFIDNLFADSLLDPTAKLLSKLNFHFVTCCNMAIRKNEYLKVGGFNPDLKTGEDTDLIKRMKKHGKIVYVSDATVYTSMRRVKKWGKLNYFYFHTTNFLKMHFLNNAHTNYEPIREKK